MSDFADFSLGGLIRTPTPQGMALAAARGQHRPSPDRCLGRCRSPLAVSGPGVAGTVAVSGAPARRRVTLFDHRTLRPLAQTWSDPVSGAYTFSGLAAGRKYLIICDDYTQTYNAAVADWVEAE